MFKCSICGDEFQTQYQMSGHSRWCKNKDINLGNHPFTEDVLRYNIYYTYEELYDHVKKSCDPPNVVWFHLVRGKIANSIPNDEKLETIESIKTILREVHGSKFKKIPELEALKKYGNRLKHYCNDFVTLVLLCMIEVLWQADREKSGKVKNSCVK